jgi:hypothetical protein
MQNLIYLVSRLIIRFYYLTSQRDNFMKNSIISLILLFSISALAVGDEIALQDNPPEKHTVVKGDTLWGIAGRYLKEPWRWPEIWNLNREQIKNPHWIYPGDVIELVMVDGKPRLQIVGKQATELETVKLSPKLREGPLEEHAIPSISPAIIGPFLTQPLLIEEAELDIAPFILRTEEGRVLVGAGEKAYVVGMEAEKGVYWNIYRPGKVLVDPESRETLGQEAIYLGKAKVVKFGDPSTIEVTQSALEIYAKDRLIPVTEAPINAYIPRAPEHAVTGRVVSIYGGAAEAGQNAVITLNKGKRDGIEIGHVLAIYRRGASVPSVNANGNKVSLKLPDERSGLLFIFRTFDKLSYALVVQSNRPVHLLDIVQTP